jgi:alpha-D-ribose 1-methylphosphonate 5-triphosphate synthase subunit PhnG
LPAASAETDKADMTVTDEISRQKRRQAAMGVLAHADAADIAGLLDAIELPAHENLREPENGLVMVRGEG